MKVLIINQSEVAELLPMNECIETMAKALATLARGEAIVPLRPVMWLPERVGALGMMPGYIGGEMQAMGVKVVSVFPGNHGTEYDSHQGTVLLFETKNGRLLSLMDASQITATRTAAVSGVATRLLARDDAHDLAILGSGVQAKSHLAAMLAVRGIQRVRVWSRNGEHARHFAQTQSQKHGLTIEVSDSVAEAVRGADIVCTTTAAPEPILQAEWLSSGVHINAVGSSVAFARELETAVVVQSRLYVDRRESTVNEAGDFLFPKKEGAVDDSHIVGEIGEILLGKVAGRQNDEEMTLFKSLGLAVEDVASAYHIYKKAVVMGKGTWVELGGERHEN
ncbi:MAG: ornithine cyclodeaminase family protein [Ardenticatenaceae bacterium]|nr:ornithine cyclodeaminase family protein [Ardenticatenaceae bacterium]